MIQEIFKKKIAEQRLIEQEEAEREKKRKLELAAVLKKAEKDIEELLEQAPPSAFRIPEKAFCSVVLKCIKIDSKDGSTKETYSVYTGYEKCYLRSKNELITLEHIGNITLQFESFVYGAIDFSNMFKDVATLSKDNSSAKFTLYYFVFHDCEAE